jgi:hypothetical protein
MTKLARSLALIAALAVLTGGAVTFSTAQDAKKAVKEGKEGSDKVGTIEIYKGKNGFRYRVKNGDGKTVAMPLPQAAWETRQECLKAIEELQAILEKGKIVDAKN